METLQRQLCSSSLEETCPSQPSGVSLLEVHSQTEPLLQTTDSPKRKESTHKRQNTRKSMTTPKKHKQDSTASKTRRRTKSKRSVVVSLQLSLLSPPKSQDEDEDCYSKGTVLEQFPPETSCDVLTSPDVKESGEYKTDILQETPFQLTPDHSPSITTPSTGSTQTPLVEYSSPLVSTSPPFSLVLEQESPYSLSNNNTICAQHTLKQE